MNTQLSHQPIPPPFLKGLKIIFSRKSSKLSESSLFGVLIFSAALGFAGLSIVARAASSTGSEFLASVKSAKHSIAKRHAHPSDNVLKLRMSLEPRTLNPISADGMAAGDLQAFVMESLLRRDEGDLTWKPSLADHWSESSDGKSYIFHLRKNALWSDGEPVTAEDIKFSYDVLFDDNFQTAVMRAYYDGISSVDVVDRETVVFHTKDSYYGNFISCALMTIVPKHIYQDSSRMGELQSTLVGSGPYRVENWNHGQSITIVKNKRWWGLSFRDEDTRSRFRVDQIRFIFVSNDQTAIELLKHGDLDFSWLTPDEYLNQTSNSNRFLTVKIENAIPKNVKSIALNLSRPVFQSLKTRQALSLLADRRGMIEHLFHGFMMPASGPWYRQSFYADPESPEFTYDPARAFETLREDGWQLDAKSHILSKDIAGVRVPLRFTILVMNEEDQRYLTIFQESARQAGVDVHLQLLNATSFNAALIQRDFDAASVDHGAVLVEFDPRSTWNTGRLPPNGFNYSGYSDVESDQLIAAAMQERSLQKRIPMMQKLYRRVNELAPEIFLFNESDRFYAVSPRVQRTNATQNYDLGLSSWSVEESGLKSAQDQDDVARAEGLHP